MSIPPYSEANSFGTPDGPPTGTRVPIKYIWPKRIAVILAGLAVVGGMGFGVKTLLHTDDSASTNRETVQSPSPASAPTQAPQSPAPAASQRPDGADDAGPGRHRFRRGVEPRADRSGELRRHESADGTRRPAMGCLR